jgi:hypothetical protein
MTDRHGRPLATTALRTVALGLALAPGWFSPAGSQTQTPAPAASDIPRVPDEVLGRRTVPLLLLTRADVRADLDLSAEQVAGADRAIATLHARAAATMGQKGDKVEAERKAIDAAQAAWVRDHLNTTQRVRLLQIDLQWEGPSALITRPLVSDSLEITPDQRAALTKAVERRDAARVKPTYTHADEQALAEEAIALLTERQRERWRAILGRPFTPQLASAKSESPARQ